MNNVVNYVSTETEAYVVQQLFFSKAMKNNIESHFPVTDRRLFMVNVEKEEQCVDIVYQSCMDLVVSVRKNNLGVVQRYITLFLYVNSELLVFIAGYESICRSLSEVGFLHYIKHLWDCMSRTI